jgi:uncharacterized membrane protein YhfC
MPRPQARSVNMAVSSISLVGGIGMIAVALGYFGYALARRLGAAYLGLGALAWFVTVAVKFAIAIPANGWVFEKTHLLADPWGTAVFVTYIGLLTGITEVGLVWIFLRYTQFGRARWPRVLAFGIGFGAIEALLLGIASLAAAIVAIKMPEKLPKQALDQLLQGDHLWIQLAPILERIFACLGHLATNVMIFYAVSRRAPRWFWFAFLYKTAIDAAASVYLGSKATTISPARLWSIEALTALWAIAGLLATLWIARRYDPKEQPRISDEPRVDPIPAALP